MADEAAIFRPEYPRPQFVRNQWLNLNGEWEFAFDDANEGLQLGWHDGRRLPNRIIVPFGYQAELSGINDKSIHEHMWYARSFEIPADWHGDILLNFGAVDYAAALCRESGSAHLVQTEDRDVVTSRNVAAPTRYRSSAKDSSSLARAALMSCICVVFNAVIRLRYACVTSVVS